MLVNTGMIEFWTWDASKLLHGNYCKFDTLQKEI